MSEHPEQVISGDEPSNERWYHGYSEEEPREFLVWYCTSCGKDNPHNGTCEFCGADTLEPIYE